MRPHSRLKDFMQKIILSPQQVITPATGICTICKPPGEWCTSQRVRGLSDFARVLQQRLKHAEVRIPRNPVGRVRELILPT